MSLLIMTFFISCLYGCKPQETDTGKDKYTVFERDYKDCVLYQSILDEGDYTFRFSLSGKCDSLTKQTYINQYEFFLKNYKNRYRLKKGMLLRLEYYEELDIKRSDIEKIKSLTEELFKCELNLVESQSNMIVFKVAVMGG